MQLTTKTKDLRAALAAVKPAVSTRLTLPALMGVRMEATDCLKLSATDTNVWIDTAIPATIKKAGAACIPFDRLQKACALWSDEETKLQIKDNLAVFTCGAARLSLPFIPPDEFPALPTGKMGQPQIVSGFCEKIARCLPFPDEHRDPITGVYLGSTVMATDGSLFIRIADGPGADFVMPREAAEAVAKMEGEATVALGEDLGSVTAGDVRLLTKRIEGRWPDVDALLPDSTAYPRVSCDRQALLDAVLYCATVANELRYTPLRLKMADGQIVASIKRDKAEDATELSVPATTGWEGEISFSTERFTKLLKAFGGETIELRIKDAISPIVVEHDGATVVLMPIRLA